MFTHIVNTIDKSYGSSNNNITMFNNESSSQIPDSADEAIHEEKSLENNPESLQLICEAAKKSGKDLPLFLLDVGAQMIRYRNDYDESVKKERDLGVERYRPDPSIDPKFQQELLRNSIMTVETGVVGPNDSLIDTWVASIKKLRDEGKLQDKH